MFRCVTRVKSLKNLGRLSAANVPGKSANSLSTKTRFSVSLAYTKRGVSKNRYKTGFIQKLMYKKEGVII